MRPQDIVVEENYRLRSSPDYGFIKALAILPPKTGINTHTYIIVKCEHTVQKDDNFGFIRYFRPVDMIRDKS